jgi:uncharacterized protein (DUF2252 family)
MMNAYEYGKYTPLMEDRITVEYFVEERGKLVSHSMATHTEEDFAAQDIADMIEQIPAIFYAAHVVTGDKRAFKDLSALVDEIVRERFAEAMADRKHEALWKHPR